MMSTDDAPTAGGEDPTAPEVRADQRSAYHALRNRCPVGQDAAGTWVLLRHEDVRGAALDAVTFSSAASRFRSVPNSMDGDEHRRFRALVDRFFDPSRIDALIPTLRAVAEGVVEAVPRGVTVDAVADIGLPVAVRAQSRWLGWPSAIEQPLLTWVQDNHEATRSGDPARTRWVAERFDELIRAQLARCRNAGSDRAAGLDVTTELMQATVLDPAAVGGERHLTEAETVSILRNWTAGDLGSVARAFGVVAHFVATQAELQAKLRDDIEDRQALDRAIDEMLRMHDPFVLNRRVTTREVEIDGCTLPQGARVSLNWTAANRDPAVFGQPDRYQPEVNAPHNLVYGIGPHACPGRALATNELREALKALLRASSALLPSPGDPPVHEAPPLGGYARVPVILM